jgi:hypothetical protein
MLQILLDHRKLLIRTSYYWIRIWIQEAQKHTDPDAQHCCGQMSTFCVCDAAAYSLDLEDALVRRHFRQGADPVPGGVRDALPGPGDQLHLRLQHHHEGLLRGLLGRHCLPHVCEVQGHLRRQPRYVQVRCYFLLFQRF